MHACNASLIRFVEFSKVGGVLGFVRCVDRPADDARTVVGRLLFSFWTVLSVDAFMIAILIWERPCVCVNQHMVRMIYR